MKFTTKTLTLLAGMVFTPMSQAAAQIEIYADPCAGNTNTRLTQVCSDYQKLRSVFVLKKQAAEAQGPSSFAYHDATRLGNIFINFTKKFRAFYDAATGRAPGPGLKDAAEDLKYSLGSVKELMSYAYGETAAFTQHIDAVAQASQSAKPATPTRRSAGSKEGCITLQIDGGAPRKYCPQ